MFWVDLSSGRNFKQLSFPACPMTPRDPSLCPSPQEFSSPFCPFTEPEHLEIPIRSRLVRAWKWAGKGGTISAFAEGKADEGALPLSNTARLQGSQGWGS